MWFLVNLIGSCCPAPLTINYKISELAIVNYNLDKLLDDSSSIARKSHRILIDLKAESFVKDNLAFSLINSAYATSCDDNHIGLKSNIIEFSIVCNKNILGITAGQPIDFDKLNIYKIGFYEDSQNPRKTINEWIGILNNRGYLLAFEWYLEFKEPIDSNEYLKFKIKIKQEDGSEFEAETNSIKVD